MKKPSDSADEERQRVYQLYLWHTGNSHLVANSIDSTEFKTFFEIL
jgi:hypothetical protein